MTRGWHFFRYSAWALALPLMGILLLIQLTSLPERLDYWLYDTVTTYRTPAPDPDVVIVAIDEKSLAALGPWPWPRTTHGELISQLNHAGAHTIVFDILFTEAGPDDARLASAMREHGRVILPLYLAPASHDGLFREYLPTGELSEAAAGVGHAHVELDSDGIARGLYLLSGLGNALWPAMSLSALADEPWQQPKIFPELDAAPYVNVRKRYHRVPLTANHAFTTYSYSDLLETPGRAGWLEGKTVFVGATAPGFGDVLPTPLSGLASPMSGVEFHANIYSAASQDRLITLAGPAWSWLIAALTLALVIWRLPRLRPSYTFGFSLLLVSALLAFFLTALLTSRCWVPIGNSLLIPVIAFPLWSARRLSLANRFLNQQIDLLERGNLLRLPSPANQDPGRILDNLITLLEPTAWLLTENGQIIRQQGMTLADLADEQARPGVWRHRGGYSQVRLTRADRHYRLGLMLEPGLASAAGERYLNRLELQPDPENGEARTSRENLSSRINRVRNATNQLNHIQQFIWRSFEHMPDGIIVTDSLGMILFANGHVPRWFREPAPSLQGMALTDLLQGHDPRTPGWSETLADTLTLQQSRTVDLHLHDRDFLIHFAPFMFKEDGQNGIIANISDISELREQQRQHREAIDFISHDVRSPLVSQLALIEQLKRQPVQVQPEQLDQLRKLARRSYHLAEEFVQLARAEQLTETRFYDCEFLSIVENARDSVSEQAFEKNIHLVLQGTDDLWLRGNAELLERAVINLLTNAIQYSEPHTTVTIQAFRAGHQACLTVADEGHGIAAAELPTLFDRFRRQQSSELAGRPGVGLGLSFVNVVVEKHRGEISVESKEGEGSTFTLKLPVAPAG